MNSQYADSQCYLVKGLYKIAKGWQERGENAVAFSIYRFIIAAKQNHQAGDFDEDDFSEVLRCYALRNIDKELAVR